MGDVDKDETKCGGGDVLVGDGSGSKSTGVSDDSMTYIMHKRTEDKLEGKY